MANSNYSDFKEIVRDIDDRKILLPDFQRDFVWKDEERQKKIVASVLTKMPIGSILLLTSSADEYCSKIIGRNADLNTSDITGDVDFLLDGQQRITVLTNVFSNVIHDGKNNPIRLNILSFNRPVCIFTNFRTVDESEIKVSGHLFFVIVS